MKRTSTNRDRRVGQRGTLRGLAALDGALVEVVRVADASLTVRFLAARGAYSSGDTLVINHYEFHEEQPSDARTHLADAIRKVTSKVQREIDQGRRSRMIDANDVVEVLLAIADELDPFVPQAATKPPRPTKRPRK